MAYVNLRSDWFAPGASHHPNKVLSVGGVLYSKSRNGELTFVPDQLAHRADGTLVVGGKEKGKFQYLPSTAVVVSLDKVAPPAEVPSTKTRGETMVEADPNRDDSAERQIDDAEARLVAAAEAAKSKKRA